MDWIYLILSFFLSILFLLTLVSNYDNDINLYLVASIMSFIMYSYKQSFRLCGFLLVILFIYLIKKNYLRTN